MQQWLARVCHGYTAGREFQHRTCTHIYHTHLGYSYILYCIGRGVIQNLWYHNHLRYISYRNYKN